MRNFFWSRIPSAPDEIYASSLQTLHLGHALWYPEPHGTGEPQIGDVGFVDEGAFVRLFNLDDASVPEKKVEFWDPPFEITEPVPPGVFMIDSRRSPLVPKDYRSHGVESKEMHASADVAASTGLSVTLDASYTCRATQGAVLILKSEAHAEKILRNRLLKKYIVRHCDRWYAYARNEIYQDIKQEDIVVVSGWVKTTADWATVAFSNTSTSSSASLEGRVGGIAGAAVGGSHSRSMTGPRMERQASNFPPAEAKRDQCVLLRRYKIRKRLVFLKKVVGGAGYDQLPSPDDEQGASRVGVAAWEDEDEETADILVPGSEVRFHYRVLRGAQADKMPGSNR
ncbi:uncharacterized protein PHACADRAFT_102964 [Phanerochaete carnosa HHB-10118-sp]|uniref:Uncharacterized protein n=1 Tax=Phanerochaete carnosa (strain HHB-10118-sp) TaxID=650164 RepID=K5VJE1_PHACS|nr:uncharacterized protein PHACADRAFT_102964 [Phanerochaete carnosa HHB-10118-sp]EKM51448.1 hypothetical protein PHACADRAFT_102964 [Phanerochaete carnosa HHB-10118-sp]